MNQDTLKKAIEINRELILTQDEFDQLNNIKNSIFNTITITNKECYKFSFSRFCQAEIQDIIYHKLDIIRDEITRLEKELAEL